MLDLGAKILIVASSLATATVCLHQPVPSCSLKAQLVLLKTNKKQEAKMNKKCKFPQQTIPKWPPHGKSWDE